MKAAAAACAAAVLCFGAHAAAEAPTVVVGPGDSLAKIAERVLGDGALWPILYRANRDRIKDPTRVYPGQVLSLPEPLEPATAESEGHALEAP